MGNTYTIQFRRGMYADFDTSKIRPGEPVAILGNDPSVPSGKALYIAFAANDVRRLCSIEDISEMVNAGEFVGPQGPKGEKGDKGDPGEKGADGTVAFESLTPEQKESLRGISIKSASVDADGNLTITFSDGDSEEVGNIMGPQGIQGSKGDKGVGIKKITDYYALSSSNTDKAFGQVWLTTPPTMTAEKKYLWHWQRTDYTDGNFYSTEKGVIGVYGEQGLKGDKGDKGPKGDNMSDEQAHQIEQNKTGIASLKTETNSLKESISTKITKFYASSQGETHLADSDDGKIMDMMVYGKSEQKQYSGKNLFKATLGNVTANGITCTANSDGTYILNGTCTTSTALSIIGIFDHILNEPLYLTGVPSGCSSYLALGRRDGDNILVTDGKNVKIDAGIHTDHIEFWITEGTVLNNVIFKPMITTDPTATYDDFEPYVGGAPSPNPDYPQEIKSVVNPTVKVCGKNLFKATLSHASNNGVICTNNGDGTYVLSGENTIGAAIFTIGKVYLSSGKKYRMIGTPKNHESSYLQLRTPENTEFKVDISDGSEFMVEESGEYIIRIYHSTGKYNNVIFKPMVTTDLTATYDDYEPYHEQTVTLPYDLYGVKVASGGNVTINGQEYVSDYFDVERGKLVQRIWKGEFDGSDDENWIIDTEYKRYYILISAIGDNYNYKKTHSYCNRYKYNTNVYLDINHENGFVRSSSAFYFRDDNITDLSPGNLRAYLAEHPLIVMTTLEKPIETDLTSEEVQALKALATYYPATNISVNSEQLDGYTVFNYPVSMENGWNYVKQQIGDTRDYIYDMDARAQDTDLQAAEAYVNSEYAVALTELEV